MQQVNLPRNQPIISQAFDLVVYEQTFGAGSQYSDNKKRHEMIKKELMQAESTKAQSSSILYLETLNGRIVNRVQNLKPGH